ncbi:NAD pyrophosphatase/5'-nucleotidase NadN [Desulfosarcina cetonica]|uniref:bifunctional metallophosphatase/5'-nucleotidase n=1 Tax=Desulfosarcina cetonica TaxID=90730 RepID=UPI0006CFD53C|nr:5'-nucleotidase C-terminal domain-containing protein [Desulfosarcina cetonica]VTR67974.1 NAD pyrophosphatase/5'-nucleotidase NadN [Desulfosarcina cetonica]
MKPFPSPSRLLIRAGILFFLAGMLLNACAAIDRQRQPSADRITILHINDVHSHLDAERVDLKIAGTETTRELGGMARVAAMVAKISHGRPNTLVLHAGDAVQGTLYYTLFKGDADAKVMNAIGFDAMAIGNHEFDDGDAWLAGFIDRLDAPVISANIAVPPDHILAGRFSPYVVQRIAGKDVGIVGLTIAAKTRDSSRPGDRVTFSDEAASLKAAVDALKASGVGRIVVLSHYGYSNVVRLAGQVRDIDVIVDGDSHTLLGDFSQMGLSSAGDYPTRAFNADGDRVCIVQAWEHGKVLGELDVTFRGDVVAGCSGTPHLMLGEPVIGDDARINVDAAIEDAGVAAIIAGYRDQIGALSQTVIGEIGEDLRHVRVPGRSDDGVVLGRGSDIAPLVAKAYYERDPKADICIQNAGGVRIGLPAGAMTYATAYALLPFSNTLVEIAMTGSEVRQVLEDAMENIARGGSTGSFPYGYGLKFVVDATKAHGRRIRNLDVRDRQTGGYARIDDDRIYVVVVSDYLAAGRDGYDTFATVQAKRGPGTNTYLDDAMAFVSYVKRLSVAGKPLMKLPAGDHCIKSYIPPPAAKDDW